MSVVLDIYCTVEGCNNNSKFRGIESAECAKKALNTLKDQGWQWDLDAMGKAEIFSTALCPKHAKEAAQ